MSLDLPVGNGSDCPFHISRRLDQNWRIPWLTQKDTAERRRSIAASPIGASSNMFGELIRAPARRCGAFLAILVGRRSIRLDFLGRKGYFNGSVSTATNEFGKRIDE